MMTTQVVSARKHRPESFQDIVDQRHVTTVLQNALRSGSLAQAFVFAGPRGVGKTTCARVLARALHCTNRSETSEPCHTCQACKRSSAQRSINLYEIDAASHNSVEDVRAIVEQMRYPPQGAAYKIYIIDEAHMLSNAAFNALLKTLEEPPGGVVFILATTEKHKILATILSRCQVFDFKHIGAEYITKRLEEVAYAEAIPYEPEALALIGQHADGSLRDALSYFDLIATTHHTRRVSYQDACTHLHVLSQEQSFEMADALLGGKVQDALEKYDAILKLGFDGYFFLIGLATHLRNVLVCQSEHAASLLSVSKDLQAQYYRQAKQTSCSTLTRVLKLLNDCIQQYSQSHCKRLHIELTLIEIASNTKPSPTPSDHRPPSKAPSAAQPKSTAQSVVKKYAKEPSVSYPSIQLPSLQQLHQQVAPPSLSSAACQKPTTPVSERVLDASQVQHAWQRYMDTCQEKGYMRLYSVRHSVPRLRKEGILEVRCSHPLHQKIILEHQGDVQEALSQHLGRKIAVQTEVVPQKASDKKPYTTLEKYRALVQRWPVVGVLQEKLLLDVES